MPRTRPPYPPEFQRQIVELALLGRYRFSTPAQVRLMVFEFIEGFYNLYRRHSALNYDSPHNYERRTTIPSAKLSTETGQLHLSSG
jgi:putative transposase